MTEESNKKVPRPDYKYHEVETIYNRMSQQYAAHTADRPERKKDSILFLMRVLNQDKTLTLNHIGTKLMELIDNTETRYRTAFSDQVQDKFWEKNFSVMIERKRYIREEDQHYAL